MAVPLLIDDDCSLLHNVCVCVFLPGISRSLKKRRVVAVPLLNLIILFLIMKHFALKKRVVAKFMSASLVFFCPSAGEAVAWPAEGTFMLASSRCYFPKILPGMERLGNDSGSEGL
ncbi:hypothetical protein Tco_1123487 [Tanacetum coccineum]|uniref:Uncharacterized protein n=1 Tax=Tanacetum coccineum TaxID=301880 RepID=A0ABQ5J3H3_9ASTR